jgi:hypothetical protein
LLDRVGLDRLGLPDLRRTTGWMTQM